MNFTAYEYIFKQVIEGPARSAPYNDKEFLNYTRLNWARQQRWLKNGLINQHLLELISQINNRQYWTVITEPWCGDAAHILPFIHRLGLFSSLIVVDYQLRDTEPFLINDYLTNGKKSIPKLIISDSKKNVAVWGPRPESCQLIYDGLVKNGAELDDRKLAVQNWYNQDKGISFQAELLTIIKLMTLAC